ncbi:hypothetical protein DSLASN_39550 [Desulfoluna limicola]|uniref:Uncharacterized protein n=1 Tax=Desulfoluna limicola TaxID=2810562 RepID=A0ABM7PLL5_9BACT|nr:hypothetical protein DSLASN_39550 [Desulfoluna limicola]
MEKKAPANPSGAPYGTRRFSSILSLAIRKHKTQGALVWPRYRVATQRGLQNAGGLSLPLSHHPAA